MKTIIAGSRGITDLQTVMLAVKAAPFKVSFVISGGARGVDQLGEQYAVNNGLPLEIFPADWTKHGKSAGYIRNILMAEKAEALIAIWDGKSKGTKHMIDIANRKELEIHIFITGD